jgi:hypothetical protein
MWQPSERCKKCREEQDEEADCPACDKLLLMGLMHMLL